MKIIDCVQRTPEWHAARAGCATASFADAILSKGKNGAEAAGRRNYRLQLAIERILGRPMESGFKSQAMRDGAEREAGALSQYEARSGQIIRQTGFCRHDMLPAGCSLDGDIDDCAGIVECKCPEPSAHVKYLREKRLPTDYIAQVRHQMWITGAQWCDFVSYHHELPTGLDYFSVRVERTELDIPGYEAEIMRFLAEVNVEHQSLIQLRAA